jgi:hypothetical protein
VCFERIFKLIHHRVYLLNDAPLSRSEEKLFVTTLISINVLIGHRLFNHRSFIAYSIIAHSLLIQSSPIIAFVSTANEKRW